MRLLFACELYHPSVGGVQEVMRQIAERLVERGHEVTVATSFLPHRKSQVVAGVSIREFRVSGNAVSGIVGEVDAYRKLVVAGDYDLLMIKAAQQWTFDALLPVLDQITRPKVFVPCGFSGLYEPTFAGYFEKMPDALREFDRLIFYASDYRDINFARGNGLTNFEIIPNGASEREFLAEADPAFRRRHGIDAGDFVVLTVGSLNEFKGHRELAEAFAEVSLPANRAVLILNGNSPPRSSWYQAVRDFPRRLAGFYRGGGPIRVLKWILRPLVVGVGFGWLLERMGYKPPLTTLVDRINHIGGSTKHAMLVDFPRSELVQAYLNADLFVFASRVEYSPLVLFESAAAGLPFLSVPVGNAEEIAQWTGGGRICPALRDEMGYTQVDPTVLADHIQALAADPDGLETMGKEGRRSWLARFTWEKIAGQYEALFERVVAEKTLDTDTDSRPDAALSRGAAH